MMMVDNTASKGGHIRSLSAPTIQVRKNRTSHLRKIFSVHNDDLSYLTRPPKGETNPTVAGQNKSAATLTQKQIGLWFRERCYTVDKMEKYEDDIYNRLVSIEKTKWKINRAQTTSLSRSASRFSQGGSFPRIDSRNNGMVSKTSREGSYQMKTTEETKEKGPTEIEIGKAEASEPKKEGTNAGTKDTTLPVVKIDLPGCVMEDKDNKPAENTLPSDTKDIPMSVSVKQNPVRPLTQQQNTSEVRPSMSPRAATSGEQMLDSARKATNTSATHKPDNADVLKPKRQGSFAFANSMNILGEDTVHRSDSQGSLDRKSMESLSKAKEIERKILNEPFTYWKKDNIGKLIKSDMPYKRREFPLPVERNDDERRKKLLDKERRAKRDQMKKYRSLCDDLDALEKWNPLDDMRFIQQYEEQEKQAAFDAQEKWKKLGMLRHWVKAFKTHEVQDLSNLDPNSEEAMRYCKYLRLKEKRKDVALIPHEEKEARKSSWKSMNPYTNKPKTQVY